jgi:hypothetical protein
VWRYSPITLTVLIIKESLNSAVQQFHEYQQKQSEQPPIGSRILLQLILHVLLVHLRNLSPTFKNV